jgi:hypothetical protein
MTRSLFLPLTFAIGMATGAAGWHLLRPLPAVAQANPTARFVPASMTASEGDKGSVAWFLSTDGRVKACLHTQGSPINCQAVNFGP